MRRTALSLSTAVSGFAAAESVPASGYATLVTLFKNLKTEADTTEKTDSGSLATLTESCNTELDDLAKSIELTVSDRTDHENKEKSAAEAVASAKQELADETTAKENADAGLLALEASYTKNDARMGYDLNQMTTALGALGGAKTKINEHAGLAENTKTKLLSTITDLKGRMTQDMQKLTLDKANGATFYAENKKTMTDKIAAHVTMIGTIGTKLSLQQGTFTREKAGKVEAESTLNDFLAAKRAKTSSCNDGQSALSASVKDASERSAALESALQILGEPASPPQFLQVSSRAGFLSRSADSPKQVLLNLLAKNKKSNQNSELASLLQAALDSSPAQTAALKKINEEIKKLLNEMHAQNQKDETDRSWCQQKQNDLQLQIDDTTKHLEATSTKLDGLNAKAETHSGRVDDAKAEIESLIQSSVSDHKGLMGDLDENKVELEQLNKDLSNLEQAKIALANKFKGRTESAGGIVMDEVQKVLDDYTAAITTNKTSRRELNAAVESTEKEYTSRLAKEKSNQRKNENQLDEASEKALSTEDLKRQVNTEMKTLEKTFASIFTADDGKCLNFVQMFESRKTARGAEMTNLNEAATALAKYCESIGLRVF